MKANRTFAVSLSLSMSLFLVASAHGGVLLTSVDHHSSGGGFWTDSNFSGWGIWAAAGNTTLSTTEPTFLNNTGTTPPVGSSISLPSGTTQLTLYKADAGSSFQTDNSDTFYFSVGAQTGSITLTPGSTYLSTNAAPSLSAPSIQLAGEVITVTGFNWYDPTVFTQNFVNQGYNPTPGASNNDVALVSFTVATPEPSTFVLGGLGAIGLAAVARRRKV